MSPLAELLHGLIGAVAHLLPPGRAGELATLVDEVEAVLSPPAAPPAAPKS